MSWNQVDALTLSLTLTCTITLDWIVLEGNLGMLLGFFAYTGADSGLEDFVGIRL